MINNRDQVGHRMRILKNAVSVGCHHTLVIKTHRLKTKTKATEAFPTYSDREREGHLDDLYTIPHTLMLQRQFQNQNYSLHSLPHT